MNKKIFALALVILASVFALLFSSQKNPAGKPNLTPITVAQWGQEKYLIYLPLYIAQEKGFFAANGLDIKLVFSGNDDQVFSAVARGDAQFGIGDPIFAAISREKGFNGLVVASIVDRVALWGVSKRDVLHTLPTSLAGLRIGTFPRPSTTYTLVTDMIEANNLADTKVVEIAIGSELALLESENADIVMLLEPAASIAESRGYHVVTSFPELWGPYAFTGLTTTEDYLKKNPEMVAAMRTALMDAITLAHSHPDEAVKVAQGLFPHVDAKIIENAVVRMIRDNTIPKQIDVDKEGWKKAVRVRQSLGDLTSGSQHLNVVWPQ